MGCLGCSDWIAYGGGSGWGGIDWIVCSGCRIETHMSTLTTQPYYAYIVVTMCNNGLTGCAVSGKIRVPLELTPGALAGSAELKW